MTENSNALAPPLSAAGIKAVIAQFLTDRLQPKLEKVAEDDSEQRAALLAAYAPKIWIADAARRVVQIQQVTHAIKYTHPDARGSSLYSAGNQHAGDSEIGTHTLGAALAGDVVGNAAALDVYKFLNLRVGEHSILALAVSNHPMLAAALSDNAEEAQAWISAFATLAQAKGEAASHKLARQIYWPLDDGGYHLLAPSSRLHWYMPCGKPFAKTVFPTRPKRLVKPERPASPTRTAFVNTQKWPFRASAAPSHKTSAN